MRNATKIFFRHPKGSLRSHTIWLGWMMFLMGCFLGVSLPVIAQDKQTEPEGDSITIEATLVTIPVIVTDAQGKYIQQLKAEDFKIFDNNTAQQINFFDAADARLGPLEEISSQQRLEKRLFAFHGAQTSDLIG